MPAVTTNAPPKRDRWLLILVASVIPLMALVLRAEGRLLVCACDEFQLWVGDTCSSRNSQQLFDPYSFTHLLHGFLLFWLISLVFRKHRPESQFALAAVLEALWEIVENTNFVINRYREQTAALGYTGDTVLNSIGDLLCAVFGFWLAHRLGWFRALIMFLLWEAVLLIWIHDSLLLQVLMLIYPVNAIKSWQMCH